MTGSVFPPNTNKVFIDCLRMIRKMEQEKNVLTQQDMNREKTLPDVAHAFPAIQNNHALLPSEHVSTLPVSSFSEQVGRVFVRSVTEKKAELPMRNLERSILKLVSVYTVLTKEHLFLYLSAQQKPITKKLLRDMLQALCSYGYLSTYRYSDSQELGMLSPVFYAPAKRGLSFVSDAFKSPLTIKHEDALFCMDNNQILTLAQLNQWHISMLSHYHVSKKGSIYRGKVHTSGDTFGYVGSFFSLTRKQIPSLKTPSLSIVAIPFPKELKTGHFLKSEYILERGAFLNELVTAAAFLSYHKDRLPYSMILLLVDDKESAIFARKLLDSYADLQDAELFFLLDYDSMKDPLSSIAQLSVSYTEQCPFYNFSFLSLL